MIAPAQATTQPESARLYQCWTPMVRTNFGSTHESYGVKLRLASNSIRHYICRYHLVRLTAIDIA
jgi:hypothetical protein